MIAGEARGDSRAYLVKVGIKITSLIAAAEASGDEGLTFLLAALAHDIRLARAKVEGDL